MSRRWLRGAMRDKWTVVGQTTTTAPVKERVGLLQKIILCSIIFLLSFSAAAQAAVTVTTASVPAASIGSPYSTTLAATGGIAPYTWTVSSGLPPGLSLSTGGTISGTPIQTGTFNFSVTAKDSTPVLPM